MSQHVCSGCGKKLASRPSLSRHRKNCRVSTRCQPVAGQKRSLPSSVTSYPEISVVHTTKNSKVEAMKKNPRIQTLLEAVINDSSDHVERYILFNELVVNISSYTTPSSKETIIEVENLTTQLRESRSRLLTRVIAKMKPRLIFLIYLLLLLLLIRQRNFFLKLLLVYAQDLKNC